MSGGTTKSDGKNIIGVDTSSKFAEKVDLDILKSVADKLDVDKIKVVSIYLNKLSVVVKINVKNIGKKVNTTDSNKTNLERKIEDNGQKRYLILATLLLTKTLIDEQKQILMREQQKHKKPSNWKSSRECTWFWR